MMETRKRKEKLSDVKQTERKKSKDSEKENVRELSRTSTPTNDASLLQQLDKVFMVKHPPELLKFWRHAVKLSAKKPLEAYSAFDSLTLTGPFLLLSHCRTNKEEKCRNSALLESSRFPTDLPEMETLLVHRNGHFCYWRDVPEEMPTMLLHVEGAEREQHFPKISICGECDLFAALQYLQLTRAKPQRQHGSSGKANDDQMGHLFPEKYNMTTYGPEYLQMLKKRRAKETIGMPFHGIGIKVAVNDKGIGYRPVSEDNKENAQLKQNIETMGTTDSEEKKSALKEKFYKMYSWIQFANDEMDFGMGLEFGHDLFMSNYVCFDGMAKSVLMTSYELLDRKQFAKILEKHMEVRRP